MFDLKKLKADLGKKLKEVELAYNELEEAAKTEDETQMKAAKDVYDAKKTEFEALESKAAEAEQHQARVALAAKISKMAEPADEIPRRSRRVAEPNGLTGFVSRLGVTTPMLGIRKQREQLVFLVLGHLWFSLGDGGQIRPGAQVRDRVDGLVASPKGRPGGWDRPDISALFHELTPPPPDRFRL